MKRNLCLNKDIQQEVVQDKTISIDMLFKSRRGKKVLMKCIEIIFLDASASLGPGMSVIMICQKNTAVFQDI